VERNLICILILCVVLSFTHLPGNSQRMPTTYIHICIVWSFKPSFLCPFLWAVALISRVVFYNLPQCQDGIVYDDITVLTSSEVLNLTMISSTKKKMIWSLCQLLQTREKNFSQHVHHVYNKLWIQPHSTIQRVSIVRNRFMSSHTFKKTM